MNKQTGNTSVFVSISNCNCKKIGYRKNFNFSELSLLRELYRKPPILPTHYFQYFRKHFHLKPGEYISALTLLAPFSINKFAAFANVPPVSQISSIRTNIPVCHITNNHHACNFICTFSMFVTNNHFSIKITGNFTYPDWYFPHQGRQR